ncbi:M20 metallopeptidase family protein [Crateriforma spongiae]|uniref:M20 metallopeptidase family protein n=1 Tax=Crateriforma spongiae TaxID=2724528 RepID=UPI0014462C8A|nr:amidohydrolase [Crateriforma spongiae]
MPTWVVDLQQHADQIQSGLVEMRRHLHRNPELSGQEHKTTRFLAGFLEQLGLHPQLAGDDRGLFADLDVATTDAKTPDRRIALRGDIDALPIADQKIVDYHSHNPGVMHACGHDVHPSVVCGAVQILTAMAERNQLPWPIALRAVLQPAEEIAQGASHMIRSGAIDGVDAILALHVDPTRPIGEIGLKAGVLTASCDMIHVDFLGKGGHGARPHLCKDPIDACTLWVQSAFRRIHRVVSADQTVVFSVGQINAGHSANVIPDQADVSGSLRTLSTEARSVALDALHDVSRSVKQQTGCEVRSRLGVSAPAVINDQSLIQLISDAAVLVAGPNAPTPIAEPSMGSEDFSYYLQKIPGAMFRLGVAGDACGHHPLHTAQFDVDERCLAIGAKIMAAAVIQYFRPR